MGYFLLFSRFSTFPLWFFPLHFPQNGYSLPLVSSSSFSPKSTLHLWFLDLRTSGFFIFVDRKIPIDTYVQVFKTHLVILFSDSSSTLLNNNRLPGEAKRIPIDTYVQMLKIAS
nr:hypothetical protein Iba_chr06fCG7790 [Ipomoea batatas]